MVAKPRRIDYGPDKFIAGVAGVLDLEEIGLYWLICTLIYSHNGPIEKDFARWAALAKKAHHRKVSAVFDRLMALDKVWIEAGMVMAKGCDDALNNARMRIDRATDNGSKGGRPAKEINELKKPGGLYPENLAGVTPLPLPLPLPLLIERPSADHPPVVSQPQPLQEQPDLLDEEPISLDRTGAREVIEIWNRTAVPALPAVKSLTSGRRALIKARSNGHAPDWESVFKRAAASPFLRGERNGDKNGNWRADFDFILTEKHWVKLDEGGYDERQGGAPRRREIGM